MKTYYHVAPRYGSGSPAQVPETTARKVALEETQDYVDQELLAGRPWRSDQVTLHSAALQGIAYSSREVGGKQLVDDLCTGEHFEVPNKDWVGNYWHSRTDRNNFKRDNT